MGHNQTVISTTALLVLELLSHSVHSQTGKKKKLRRGCSATNGTACTPEHLGKCVWSCVVAEGTTTVVDGKAGPA